MKLSATYRLVEDVIVVHCRAQIISSDEVEELSKEVRSQTCSEQRRVVLNVGEVERLPHGDLGNLWLWYMWARAAGWDIKFCCLRADLKMLLRSTGIEDVFEIYEDEVQAIASFARPHFDDPQYNRGALSARAS